MHLKYVVIIQLVGYFAGEIFHECPVLVVPLFTRKFFMNAYAALLIQHREIFHELYTICKNFPP